MGMIKKTPVLGGAEPHVGENSSVLGSARSTGAGHWALSLTQGCHLTHGIGVPRPQCGPWSQVSTSWTRPCLAHPSEPSAACSIGPAEHREETGCAAAACGPPGGRTCCPRGVRHPVGCLPAPAAAQLAAPPAEASGQHCRGPGEGGQVAVPAGGAPGRVGAKWAGLQGRRMELLG